MALASRPLGTSVNEVTCGWSGGGFIAVPLTGESSSGSSRAGGHFMVVYISTLGGRFLAFSFSDFLVAENWGLTRGKCGVGKAEGGVGTEY
jgi:hypothetical protein